MAARQYKSRIAREAAACDSRREAAHQGPAVLFEWLMQQRRFTEAFDYAGRRIVKIRALPKGNRKRERSLPAWEDRARRAEWAGRMGRGPGRQEIPFRVMETSG